LFRGPFAMEVGSSLPIKAPSGQGGRKMEDEWGFSRVVLEELLRIGLSRVTNFRWGDETYCTSLEEKARHF